MKRITISLDDKLYRGLVDYAAEGCKKSMSRLSVSRSIRELLSAQLENLGYYPLQEVQKKPIEQKQVVQKPLVTPSIS